MPPIIPPPQPKLPSIFEKLKTTYLLWHQFHQTVPKAEKFSLGLKIDTLFVETIEAVASAIFLSPADKAPYVRLAIRKFDTTKILLMIL